MFLRGRIVTSDGTPVPYDVVVERICNLRVRQQVYASTGGDFSMQLGSKTDTLFEADSELASDRTSQPAATGKDPAMGIPRDQLMNCELRASASGFRSGTKTLMGMDVFGSNVDVGTLTVERVKKVEGTTLNAAIFKAPNDARKAYEKGMNAEKNGKLAEARKYFETAVQRYPNFANAWYELGRILRKVDEKDAARAAFSRATAIDFKFMPPYLSLAAMAFEAGNWSDVLSFTNQIADRDPWKHSKATGYFLDLDSVSYAEAYYYNAFANYRLQKFEEAEKSGLEAERHVDLGSHFPQLHLLMTEIFARKNDCSTAASELRTYLELVPHAPDSDRLRQRLALLESCRAARNATGR